MQAFRDISIKRKLMLMTMLTSTVALLLACIAFVAYDQVMFRRSLVRNLSTLGKIIGDNCKAALPYQSAKDAKEVLDALMREKHIVSACVYEDGGEPLATYLRAGASERFPTVLPSGETFRFRK